jgi:hypothetical protein
MLLSGSSAAAVAEPGSDFVVPVDWEEADDTHWWIRLRCG